MTSGHRIGNAIITSLGVSDRLNWVEDMWENPCDIGWTLYVKTFAQATPVIFWNLVGFSPWQFGRGMIRPRRALARRGGHRRMGRFSRFINLGDLGNEAGKRMPMARQLSGRHVTNGVLNLWIVDNFIQRQLWNWLLLDTAAEFSARWTSLMYQTRQCQEANRRRVRWDNMSLGAVALSGWTGVGSGDLVYDHSSNWEVPGAFTAPPGGLQVAIGGEIENTTENAGHFELRVFRQGEPERFFATSGETFIPPNSRQDVLCGGFVPPGEAVSIASKVEGIAAVSANDGYGIGWGTADLPEPPT